MKCPRCETQNPDEAVFCLNCGTRIAAVAPSAGAQPPSAGVHDSSVANLRAAIERMVADRIADETRLQQPPPSPFEEVPPASSRRAPAPVSPAPVSPAPAPPAPVRSAPVSPAPSVPRPVVRNDFRLIFVHHDGTDGTSYHLQGDQIDIGRTQGDLLFEDPYLSPRHARIVSQPEGQILSDLESRNGVFIRLRAGADLEDGDLFLVGRQLLKFELVPDYERDLRPAVQHNVMQFGTQQALPSWGRLRQMGPTGVSHDVFYFGRDQVVIGREQGDIVFSDDQFLSRRHAYVSRQGGVGHLEDLGSSNGTFVRLRSAHLLVPGDVVRMGNVLLRFEHD
ncbi:MAG TPA: FHA domain-containing protein [Polyangia bacterium]|nr:FHA domain-containing protein [Polyangia bacterium]